MIWFCIVAVASVAGAIGFHLAVKYEMRRQEKLARAWERNKPPPVAVLPEAIADEASKANQSFVCGGEK